MARVTAERAPAFTSAELERLVDGILAQSAPIKRRAKDVRILGVYGRGLVHCPKRWEDLKRWAWKRAKAQLGMASQ
ncbi:hypothetical protein NDU88_000576 [Pleurodeles waltl]|uniref:Uncharacterized protein n=1 Tax=Pleurodeles waltl TaxID=8319 RepID=A0AAV7WK34_PLEWA|nr:hypothetical protein NDU88_000576 [Pleurodeles waltl]